MKKPDKHVTISCRMTMNIILLCAVLFMMLVEITCNDEFKKWVLALAVRKGRCCYWFGGIFKHNMSLTMLLYYKIIVEHS